MGQLPYFGQVTEVQLSRLADRELHRSSSAGRIIFLESDASHGLWILEKGRVKANKLSSDGQEFMLRFFGTGDTFNDLAARAGHTILKTEKAGHQINMKEIRDE